MSDEGKTMGSSVAADIANIVIPFVSVSKLISMLVDKCKKSHPLGLTDQDSAKIEQLIQYRIDEIREEAHAEGKAEGREEAEAGAPDPLDLDVMKEIGMRVLLRQKDEVLILLERHFPDLNGIRALFEGVAA